MNHKYMRYYNNFKPPLFAPTYRPTEEEFADPLEYVRKIKPEAEKYGVVKVKPPKSFRPPFAIESERFVFIPRVQRLNEIDGLLRLRLLFEMEISTFWELQGQDLNNPMIDNKFVDLYKLSRFVAEKGGAKDVTEQRKWAQIGKQLGFTSHFSSRLSDIYYKWIAPFEKCLNEIEEEKKSEEEPVAKCSQMETRSRAVEPKSRMMAGYRLPIKDKKVKSDPVDDVVCKKCHRGDDEDCLLLCEECNAAMHTFCCEPPLADVPEADWHCYKCIKARVKSIGESFGFHDAQQEYNLVTFAEYANKWKRDHFRKNILEVTQEEVEKAFWRKVVDMNDETAVKYGADLLASKVGSGFPTSNGSQKRRKSDENWKVYAEHPWNLNNMPVLKDSVLSYIGSGISGMMVPWVYIGMCFTTFCWHTEDHWTYSINYLHWGERKIWYGVSGLEGEKFDKVLNSLVPNLFRKHPDLLHHMTTIINPMILLENGVNVYTVHQEPGEFVITFPRAYHAGYNEGLNCAEAVNFALPDWLRLGRLCVADYARVHRKCVFSHDELVVHMVDKLVGLKMSMRIAIYDELERILSKEKKWLARFPKPDFRYERTKFERIPDDQRECVFCKTTLFLSALECKHARLCCLKHSDHLCDSCSSEDFYVKYRYALDEVLDMKQQIAATVDEYVKWKEKTLKFLHPCEDDKLCLDDARELLRLADILLIPSCETLDKLSRLVKDCESTFETIRSLLFSKIRKSSETEKYDYNSVMKLKLKLEKLSFSLPENLSGFKNFVECLSSWKKRVEDLSKTGFGSEVDFQFVIDESKRLITEAGDFNVDLPEVDDIRKKLNVYHWLNVASKLLQWRFSCGKRELEARNDDYFLSDVTDEREKWKLKAVEKLVDEGTVLMEDNEEIQGMVDEVHSCMKLGWNKEFAAEKILSNEENEGAGLEKANEIWSSFEVCDWLSMDNLDELRTEIVKARNIQKLYTEGREKSDITFTDLETYEGLCSQSFFMKQSQIHKDIISARSNLLIFMEKICSLFIDSTKHYSLYDIVCGREDLEILIKGSFTPLIKLEKRSLIDEWSQLEVFTSSEELEAHLRDLDNSLCISMHSLRKMNAQRNVSETCFCSQTKLGEDVFLTCCLCHSKIHGSCAKWNDFFAYLPSGYYLCVRCLRGRRPNFDEVYSAFSAAPPSLERTLIQFAVKRCSKAYEEANSIVSLLDSIDSSDASFLRRLDECLIRVFSSVIVDRETLSNIVAKLPLLHKINEAELLLLERIKTSNSILPKALFLSSTSDVKAKRVHSEDTLEAFPALEQKRVKSEV